MFKIKDMTFDNVDAVMEIIATNKEETERIIKEVTGKDVHITSVEPDYDARIWEGDQVGILVRTEDGDLYYFQVFEKKLDHFLERTSFNLSKIHELEAENDTMVTQELRPIIYAIFLCDFDPIGENGPGCTVMERLHADDGKDITNKLDRNDPSTRRIFNFDVRCFVNGKYQNNEEDK